ncbi:MAG: cupin domain-containing protein [Deltaproteobacteria bacterium]|nr:cupin domain-containing protein [Deltaproteobacteria bacterium]
MSFTRLPFPDLPWQPGNHPLEEKKLGDAPGVVLLRFAPGFRDPEVCRGDHVLYVISGEFTLGLEGEDVVLRAGEACTLRAGSAHRAENAGPEPVILLAVSAPLLAP